MTKTEEADNVELAREIVLTIMMRIGHRFGINEDRVYELMDSLTKKGNEIPIEKLTKQELVVLVSALAADQTRALIIELIGG